MFPVTLALPGISPKYVVDEDKEEYREQVGVFLLSRSQVGFGYIVADK